MQPAPYGYPPLQPSVEPRVRRPAAPKVMGVLSIVFGGLTLLYSLMGTMAGSFLGAAVPAASDVAGPPVHVLEAIAFYYLVMSLTFLLMSAWLIALGIGQVGYKRWACGMSVVWSIVALGVLLGMAVLQFAIVGPAFEEITLEAARQSDNLERAPAAFGNAMAGVMAVMTIFFLAPFPIITLVMFRRRVVIEAMAS